jgi:AraC-like DNA-binding protein
LLVFSILDGTFLYFEYAKAFIELFGILIITYNFYIILRTDYRKIKRVTLFWLATIIYYISSLIVLEKLPIVFIWFILIPLMMYIIYSLEAAIYGIVLVLFSGISVPVVSNFSTLNLFFNCTDTPCFILNTLNITSIYFCFLFRYFTNEIRKMEKKFEVFNNCVLKEESTIKNDHSPSVKMDTKLEKLYHTILAYFETEKPYTNPEFNINMLSKALHSNVGYVSRILNQKTNKNFICFVNEYRINEVLVQFNKKDHLKFTIKHIYTKAGFSNQSTFNRVFKQNVGVKPSEYLENLK